MTDEEIWMRYFAGAFAGRQGSLSQEYINDYKDWADVALKSHRDRWPAPVDQPEICESHECAVKHTHATTDCPFPVESKPKEDPFDACECDHIRLDHPVRHCEGCQGCAEFRLRLDPAADTAKPSPEGSK